MGTDTLTAKTTIPMTQIFTELHKLPCSASMFMTGRVRFYLMISYFGVFTAVRADSRD